ncbi:MAG: BamA/TamA family outer membrane protein, partial [Prevotella sp.]|nr:BamA/TamA family outer membrane protein [Prevotella sp.]
NRPAYASYLADTIAKPGEVDLRLQLADSLDSRITRQWYIGKMDLYLFRKGVRTTADSITYRSLTIHYNGKKPLMRPRVILSNLRLYSRMMYSYDAYQESISRLSGNENFSSIDFAFAPRDTTLTCDTLEMSVYCMFNKPYDISLEGKFTGKTSSRIGPGLELTLSRRNFFRYGEKLSLRVYGSVEWQNGGGGTDGGSGVNSYEYGAEVSLELPRLAVPFKVRRRWYTTPNTLVKLSSDLINRGDFFNRNIISAELTYTMQPNARVKHVFSPLIVEYDYMNRSTARFQAILDDNPYLRVSMKDQFIPKMRYTFAYSSPASYLSPITWSVTLSEASNIISLIYMAAGKGWNDKDKSLIKNPYAQFVKAETDFTKSWRLSGHGSLVGHIGAGVIYSYGNSDDAPYSEQFYVGGANSVRAFTVRAIGPGRYHTSDRGLSYAGQTGDIKFTANLEYRPRLFGNLYGAVFLDAGNVWKIRDDGSRGADTTLKWNSIIKDMAVGTGIGIRYDLDFFVIRLDWGVGLHIPYDTSSKGFFNIGRIKDCNSLHLAIGYPF